MTLGRTSLLHFVTQVVKSVAGFLTTFAIARVLGADVLGTFTMASSLIIFLTIPAKTLAGTMNKRVSERQEPNEYFSAGMLAIAAFSVAIILVLYIGRGLVAEYLDASVIGLLVLLFAGTVGYDVYTAVLTGEQKVAASGAVGSVEQICRLLFQVGLILAGFELVGLFVGNVLSLTAALLVGILVSDLSPARPRRGHFVSLYEFAKYAWASHLKGRSFSWIDVLLLGFFVDSALVGIYEVSWTLASTLILVSQSVQQTLFPKISQLGIANDYDRVNHLLTEGLSFVGVFSIPGLFGAAIVGSELLSIFNSVFARGGGILLLLITARILDAYARQFLSVIAALDRPDLQFRVDFIFVAVNTVLNVVLIWAYGWYGAAVATALSAGLELLLGYYYIGQIIGTPNVPYDQILRQVVAACIMSASLYLLAQFITLTSAAAVVLVFVGASVYLTVLVTVSKFVRQKLRMLLPASVPY